LITLLFVSGAACAQDKPAPKKLKNPIVIDVRTQAEYDAGHIEGAILIPHDQIKDKIKEIVKNKNKAIALYCRSGRRSGIAQGILKELGYTKVENYGSMGAAQELLKK
jgi:phage shock protein E